MQIKLLVMMLIVVVLPPFTMQIKWQSLPDIPVYDAFGKTLGQHRLQVAIPTTIKKFGQICFHRAAFQAPKYRVLNMDTNCSTYLHSIGRGKVYLFQEICGYLRESKLAATVCIDEPKAPTQVMDIAGNQYLLCFEDTIVSDEFGPKYCDHEILSLATVLEANRMKMKHLGLTVPAVASDLSNWNLDLGDIAVPRP